MKKMKKIAVFATVDLSVSFEGSFEVEVDEKGIPMSNEVNEIHNLIVSTAKRDAKSKAYNVKINNLTFLEVKHGNHYKLDARSHH